jgi:hypothetical protein
MSSAAQTSAPLQLTEEQDRAATGLASTMRLAAAALLLLGAVKVVSAVLQLTSGTVLDAVLDLAEGGLSALLGAILMTGAGDVAFMVTAKKYDRDHLLNGVMSLRHFYQVQLGLGILLAVVGFFRLVL